MRRFLYHSSLLFATLVAVLLPFPWRLLSFQQDILPRPFGPALYTSDSAAQALLYAGLALAAGLFTPLLFRRNKGTLMAAVLRYFLLVWLAAVLARYGADKLFKTQFYLPEPTTLYTPFGMLEKDILYWSTIGTSRPYNLFLGGTEMLAALLLLFRRTRRAGLLLALAVFIQVLAVDLGFGIDVRMFSSFLLLLAVLLIAPDAGSWWRFLKGEAVATRSESKQVVHRHRGLMRVLIGALIALEALWPALRSGNWNDDTAARPPLHGAYAVLDQAPESRGGLPPARRLLLHRAGYFVLQDSSERMHPFPYVLDTATQVISLQGNGAWQRYRIIYHSANEWSLLRTDPIPTVLLRVRALPWRALPALR